MCIIISREAENTLPMSVLEGCQEQNPDGWGIMFAHRGRVVVERGMDWQSFETAYLAHPTTIPMVIHFRWRTHGATDLKNTHPYQVLTGKAPERDLWVMHNGVINSVRETHRSMSDTWHWVRDVARPLLLNNPGALRTKEMQAILEGTIDYSRVVFLDGTGQVTYLNPRDWRADYGCQFSNGNYTSPKSAYAGYYGRGASFWDQVDEEDWRSYTSRSAKTVNPSPVAGKTGWFKKPVPQTPEATTSVVYKVNGQRVHSLNDDPVTTVIGSSTVGSAVAEIARLPAPTPTPEIDPSASFSELHAQIDDMIEMGDLTLDVIARLPVGVIRYILLNYTDEVADLLAFGSED